MGKRKHAHTRDSSHNALRAKSDFPLKQLATFSVLGLLVYWQVLFNGFVWDDQWQIIEAKHLLVIQNIPQLFISGIDFTYRPLFFASIAVINTLFGLQPAFYHAVNLLLHIANTCLVLFIFQRFFTRKSAFIFSLLFLVHPMTVEPVANISFMMEPLYVLFGCLSFLIFTSQNGVSSSKKFFLGALLLLCSLLSKESGVIFMLIILAYFTLFQRRALSKIAVLMLVVFGVYLFMRLGIAGSPITESYDILPYIPIQRLSLSERLLNIPAIFSYYLTTFFMPIPLMVQQYWIVKDLSITNFYIPLSFLLLTCVGASALTWKLVRTNSNLYLSYLFFLVWFTFGILFHLQIIPLTMTVADRWFYLPMIGLLGLIACITQSMPNHLHTRLPKSLLLSLIVIGVTLLSVRSILRTHDWKDNYTLYSHDLKISQDNYSLENDLGAELLKRKQYGEAKKHLDRSIQLAPDWWINWTNLGTYFKNKNELEFAKQAYEEAISNGKYKEAYTLYAKMLLYSDEQGSTVSAKRIAEAGLKQHPRNVALWEIVALSCYQLGEREQAAAAAHQAYIFSQDKRYAALAQAIAQGVEFSIAP